MASVQEFISNFFIKTPRGFVPQRTAQDTTTQNNLNGILFGALQGGGIIIPQVTITESHNDQVVTTDHPVESGAYPSGVITDHAYTMPATVRVQAGWSRSPTLDILNLNTFQIFNLKSTYEQLVTLKNQRILLQLFTGKRVYSNMLIVQLSTSSDEIRENNLILDIDFKEIVFAQTQAVTLSYNNSSFPQNSSNPVNTGSSNLVPSVPSNAGALNPNVWTP